MRTAGSRRMRARALLAVAAAASLALTGCAAPTDPSPTDAPADAAPDTTTTPEPTPLTEAEALAIAVETYEAYLAASGDVYEQGDAAAAAFRNVATGDFAENELAQLLDVADSGDWIAEGQIHVVKSQLQTNKPGEITAYVCTDASDARLYQEGSDPEPTRDQTIFTLEIGVVSVGNGYKVNRSETWDDKEFCSEFS